MSERRAAALAGLVIGIALLVVIWLTTPWTPLAGVLASDPSTDFTAAEIARQEAFRSEVLPWSTLSWVLSVLVPVVVGLSPLGGRIADWVRVRRWWLVVPLVVVAIGLAANLLTLLPGIMSERVLRRFGLSTQDWVSWTRDRVVGWLIGTVALVLLALLLVGLARRWRSWWWVPAGLAAAVLVVVVSFAYPILVEPRFNEFTAMPAGALRDDLMEMAAADGVPVRDVLVADASRRTTSLNAYVSGFGSTRRIVVYDTLLKLPPEQVRLVVAHELGHAKRDDVLHGTMVGALAALFAVVLLRLVVGSRLADPRRTALLLALIAVGTLVASPAQNLISRRIEARADVHSLDLTRDPNGFAEMQHQLAVTNLSGLDPAPWRYVMFASHPTSPQRIQLARIWGRQHGIDVPPLAASR
jgi:Zn-dependent protease with chaperone function